MVDFQESSQLCLWTYPDEEHLLWLRNKASHMARTQLFNHKVTSTGGAAPDPTEAKSFARGWTQRFRQGQETADEYEKYSTEGPWENDKGKPFLTAAEETTMVSYWAPKVAKLVGTKAVVPRLKRASKVTATAALFYRRFFLSNSVMCYDPKAILVAAAFLASKVEDASADVRYLEEAMTLFNTPVSQDQIIAAELALIQGISFDLLCFHPYKAVIALTGDLRTFLKSDKGKKLVARPVSGQDLEPLYQQARSILEDALLRSDLALLYTPGQIGLASLMVAQEVLYEKYLQEKEAKSSETTERKKGSVDPVQIDWHGYVNERFDNSNGGNGKDDKEKTWHALQELRLKLRKGSDTPGPDALKPVNKKLKKVRVWGAEASKKRKKEEAGSGEAVASTTGSTPDATPSSKRIKTE